LAIRLHQGPFPFPLLTKYAQQNYDRQEFGSDYLETFREFQGVSEHLAAEEDFKSCAELKSFLQLQDSPFENYKKTFGNPKPSIIPPNKIGSFSEKNIKSYDISKIVSHSPPKKERKTQLDTLSSASARRITNTSRK
jgi:hypothetical protein